MRPLLSVIVPTIGRPSLAQTLASVRDQAGPEDVEICVVGDTHALTWRRPLTAVPAICAAYQARYLEHDGGLHCYGQPQRQRGQAEARGHWLWWLADDDAAEPGALGAIVASIRDHPPGPRLFRVIPRCGWVVWRTKELALGNLDANGVIVPNEPAKLGPWQHSYEGDYWFAEETIRRWGGQMRWEDALISARVA